MDAPAESHNAQTAFTIATDFCALHRIAHIQNLWRLTAKLSRAPTKLAVKPLAFAASAEVPC